jgi:hypothetical protein
MLKGGFENKWMCGRQTLERRHNDCRCRRRWCPRRPTPTLFLHCAGLCIKSSAQDDDVSSRLSFSCHILCLSLSILRASNSGPRICRANSCQARISRKRNSRLRMKTFSGGRLSRWTSVLSPYWPSYVCYPPSLTLLSTHISSRFFVILGERPVITPLKKCH